MRFMWDPKYSVNIRSIDMQHQKFFEVINNLYYLSGNIYQEPSKEQVQKDIKELKEYAETHLLFEEKCFKEFDYDEAKVHIKAHDVFREYISECAKKINNPKVELSSLTGEIAEFCKNWLSVHILEMDHKYISHFLKNGM